ncbi:hypothetical protein PsYK624_101510 [Phanerochaete sordida]|uniref:Uncharacterized protein n=1 Tax=Phanerochaete sordida TaxID=48140 RepID=A0A9P3LGU1_9APHY|nr:hypothetical protein PsYK624_101510 [Phanerochaete sordida]
MDQSLWLNILRPPFRRQSCSKRNGGRTAQPAPAKPALCAPRLQPVSPCKAIQHAPGQCCIPSSVDELVARCEIPQLVS